MRVELHHSWFSPVRSGLERRMHALLGRFLARGLQVAVLAPREGVDDPAPFQAQGIHIMAHPSAFTTAPLSLLDPVMYARRVERWLQQTGAGDPPGLVLCFSYYYVVAAKRRWPSAQVWFLPGGVMWDWFKDLHAHRSAWARVLLQPKRLLAVWAERHAVERADRILVDSDWLGRRFARFYPHTESKTQVFPVPVDCARFAPSERNREAVRRELGLSSDARVILALGRLDARKNYGVLIRALPRLTAANWRLLVAGTGAEEPKLRRLTRGLGLCERVVFAGLRSDPERIYAAADVYCQPSIWESYSSALQEATASGLPCIISSINVNRDLTEGVNVLLAAPHDPADWARKIDLLLGNPDFARRMGQEARRFAERRPSWPDVVAWLLQQHQSAVERHS